MLRATTSHNFFFLSFFWFSLPLTLKENVQKKKHYHANACWVIANVVCIYNIENYRNNIQSEKCSNYKLITYKKHTYTLVSINSFSFWYCFNCVILYCQNELTIFLFLLSFLLIFQWTRCSCNNRLFRLRKDNVNSIK